MLKIDLKIFFVAYVIHNVWTYGFKALPFKTENADVDLINYISEHGFNFFIDYHKPVKDPQGSDFDRKYFTDYLRMFIFNDSIFNRDRAPDFTSTRENNHGI